MNKTGKPTATLYYMFSGLKKKISIKQDTAHQYAAQKNMGELRVQIFE